MDNQNFERIKKEARDSGEKIYLAGLGALGKIGSEGKKAFERLVEEGREVHKEIEPKAERLAESAKEAAKGAVEEGRRAERWISEKITQAVEKMAFAKESRVAELEKRLDQALAEIASLKAAKAQEPESGAEPNAGEKNKEENA